MQSDEQQDSRYLTRSSLALILAGGQGSRLHELTKWRAKPAVPFGGKFRIIDFALSNCINSGIRRVGVMTQYKSHSLVRHIVRGWSGFKAEFGEFVEILPASKRIGDEWYEGTADAVYQNIDIIRTHDAAQVLILGGDHIYKMDYGSLLACHRDKQADVTVSCIEVSVDEARNTFGVLKVDDSGKVVEFQEKPAEPAEIPGKAGRVLASMGNYVFNRDFLFDMLITDSDNPKSTHDFGHDIIPYAVKHECVIAHRMGDGDPTRTYWRDVGTLDAFYDANMELVGIEPELNLYDRSWPIYTYQVQLPSAKFVHNSKHRRGMATDSIVSGGCVISGSKLSKSLLFSNVRTHSYSRVKSSVLLPDVVIEENCRIKNAVIDTGSIIPRDTIIGYNLDDDRERGFRVTSEDRTLVTPDHLGQNLHLLR